MQENKDKEPDTLIGEASKDAWDEVMGDAESVPDLQEHLEGVEVADEEPKEETVAEASEEATDDTDTTVDETTQQEEIGTVEERPADTEQTDAEEIKAPENWSKHDREMFDGLPAEAQEFLHRRHSDMEKSFYKKAEENAEALEINKIVNEATDPSVRANLQRQGITNQDYVRQMIHWNHMAATNPVGFARNMVQQLGLNPADVFDIQPSAPTDPNAALEQADPINQEIAQLRNQVQQTQQHMTNQEGARALEEQQRAVEEFATAKDDKGQLLHPHFEAVRKDMAMFVQANPNSTYQQAYDAAVAYNPEIREQAYAKPQPEPVNQERVKKAVRAQQANIKGSSGAVDVPDKAKDLSNTSLRDIMEDSAQEIGYN